MAADLDPSPATATPGRGGRWIKRVVVVLMLPLAFYLGMVFEFHAGPDVNYFLAPLLLTSRVQSLDLGTLNQEWEYMQRYYAKPGLRTEDAFNAAAKGMVHDLLGPAPYQDNFSAYFTPEELKQNQEFLAGSFGGIGATMQSRNGQLVVTALVPGSPAQGAGLKENDAVTRIDGNDASGLSVNEAVQKIRGKVGTHVRLTILRAGKTFDVDITRAQISVPSVRSKDLAKGVLYIRIYEFGEKTADDFHQQLAAGLQRGDRTVILDLRRNPGGFVTAADRVVSEFVRSGVTVTVVGRSSREQHNVTGQGVAFDPRLVVLVDENSASAAEIVAGALQDYKRGPLVGQKTFGKGLVEQDYPLRNGGDLHLTIAYWYRPLGKSINLVGITPDQQVALSKPEDMYQVDESGADPRLDTQLQAALGAAR